ncbi:MAG: hypothetical protein HQM14_21985 [SAR324 cluster bacterium]|nr:hypothetical protein [SAR324 cluster bacterium]
MTEDFQKDAIASLTKAGPLGAVIVMMFIAGYFISEQFAEQHQQALDVIQKTNEIQLKQVELLTTIKERISVYPFSAKSFEP